MAQTTEQAQEALKEIRRLLMEREKASKIVQDIDVQIAHLAGAETRKHAPRQQHLSRSDFMAIIGGAQ